MRAIDSSHKISSNRVIFEKNFRLKKHKNRPNPCFFLLYTLYFFVKDESSSDAGYDQAEEEELRQSMDLHQLISQQVHISGESPPISADQVIEEIDEIMQV
jgi:hypothetical protein